jgi:hypothetical protein
MEPVGREEDEGVDPAVGYIAWPTPRMLPWDTADFTGRGDQLLRITAALSSRADPHAAFAAVIDGMAGVGKSAFAIHAAHQLADRFPDGELYADLLGTSPEPAEPRAVLATFLRLLGIAPDELPEPEVERAALYRSLLAKRRVLVVLDDVRDVKQLAPLVPASPGCALLVTTRDRHVGVAGALQLSLSPLTGDESYALLSRIAGADRIAAEPKATDEILAACAGLPLAVRAVGGRIAARPAWQIADFADRLARPEEFGFFDELRFGQHDVRAAFEAGLTGWGSAVLCALCALGRWNGVELGLTVASSLLERSPGEAEEILERLVDLHLLESPRRGRYQFHDVVRKFAAERAANPPAPKRTAAPPAPAATPPADARARQPHLRPAPPAAAPPPSSPSPPPAAAPM